MILEYLISKRKIKEFQWCLGTFEYKRVKVKYLTGVVEGLMEARLKEKQKEEGAEEEESPQPFRPGRSDTLFIKSDKSGPAPESSIIS